MVKLGLLGLAVMVTGACVGSVNPIYTKADVAFDSTLLGTWGDSASKEQAVVTRAGATEYDLSFTDEHGKHAHFSGHLTRFRGLTVMDVKPGPLTDSLPDDYRAVFVPLHVFIFLDPRRDRLRFTIVDPVELGDYLVMNPRALAHTFGDSAGHQMILTAPPQVLQEFVAQYRMRPKAMSDTVVWRRG